MINDTPLLFIKSAIKIFISLLPNAYEDIFDTLIDNQSGVAYIPISKAANSAIKNTVLAKNGGSEYTGLSVHGIAVETISSDLAQYQTRRLRKVKVKLESYKGFTAVRNPYDRLLSCYTDHIKKKNVMFVRSPVLRRWYGLDNTDLSFKQFVEIICKIPDSLADRHFRSQYASIYLNGDCLVDYILKVETLNEDWMKCPILSKYKPPAKVNVNKYESANKLYTEELKKKVFLRYIDDFEIFNYPV